MSHHYIFEPKNTRTGAAFNKHSCYIHYNKKNYYITSGKIGKLNLNIIFYVNILWKLIKHFIKLADVSQEHKKFCCSLLFV